MLVFARVSVQFLSDVAFGLTVDDGVTFAAAISALILVGGVAASLPATRASSVDPMVALRAE